MLNPKTVKMGATVLPSSVRPCSSDTLLNQLRHGLVEDSSEALPQTQVAVSLRRDDSRIAADLDWYLKAPKNHEVVGNSAFFSRSEKATFEEILKLDSLSQVSDSNDSKTVAPRVLILSPNRHNISNSSISVQNPQIREYLEYLCG